MSARESRNLAVRCFAGSGFARKPLGSGRSWPRLVPIQLRIGDPIPAPASRRRPDLDATTALLQERINALLDQGPQHP